MDLDRWSPTECAISTVHDDVVRDHIMTRLDGPSLACAACASSRFRSIAASDGASLWKEATRAAWPSTSSPPLADLIPSFPNGHLSFFSDSHPSLLPVTTSEPTVHPVDPPSGLISAVDLFYEHRMLLSQVVEIETHTAWFGSSPFRIDALGPKESIGTVTGGSITGTCGEQLARGMRMSWILIDRERRRAANVSSSEPVEVQRHWLTGDVRVKFATTVGVTSEGEGTAQCVVVVTCQDGEGEGEVRVKEVSLQVEDVEGTVMSGRESMGIMWRVMSGRERARGKVSGDVERRRFEAFERRKKEMKESRRRREGQVDVAFVAVGVLCYFLFWGLLCY